MLAKSIKIAMVFAIALTFFGGTALADGRGRDSHHPSKWNRGHNSHKVEKWSRHHGHHHAAEYRHHAARPRVYRSPQPAAYHGPQHRVSAPHPLAPRIVFLGPIPVPVPPPPHEVLGYLAGHR